MPTPHVFNNVGDYVLVAKTADSTSEISEAIDLETDYVPYRNKTTTRDVPDKTIEKAVETARMASASFDLILGTMTREDKESKWNLGKWMRYSQAMLDVAVSEFDDPGFDTLATTERDVKDWLEMGTHVKVDELQLKGGGWRNLGSITGFPDGNLVVEYVTVDELAPDTYET